MRPLLALHPSRRLAPRPSAGEPAAPRARRQGLRRDRNAAGYRPVERVLRDPRRRVDAGAAARLCARGRRSDRERDARRRRRRAHGHPAGAPPAAGVIDLRSDFCAPPTDEMWSAMRDGSEETVAKLELTVGFELGKEAAVFCPTCTAANLAALMALGEHGRAAIV